MSHYLWFYLISKAQETISRGCPFNTLDFADEITWSLCEKDLKSVPLLLRAYEVSFFLLQELFRCTWVMALTAPPGFHPSSKVRLLQRRHWSRLFLRVNPVAKFIVPDWGDKVDSGIGLSYRRARLHRLAGLYDNPITESTLSASQGLPYRYEFGYWILSTVCTRMITRKAGQYWLFLDLNKSSQTIYADYCHLLCNSVEHQIFRQPASLCCRVDPEPHHWGLR